jgi:hypothetical protein
MIVPLKKIIVNIVLFRVLATNCINVTCTECLSEVYYPSIIRQVGEECPNIGRGSPKKQYFSLWRLLLIAFMGCLTIGLSRDWKAPMWLTNFVAHNSELMAFLVFVVVIVILALIVAKDIKTKNSGLYSIIPILKEHQKINYKIGRELKQLDISEMQKLTNVSFGEKFHFSSTSDFDKAKQQMKENSDIFSKQSAKSKDIIIDAYPVMQDVSTYLDVGLGLKEERERNHDYKRIMKRVDSYYDTYSNAINDRLDKLIQSHIKSSEAVVALIAIERVPPLKELLIAMLPDKYKVDALAGAETSFNKASRRIRVKIGECIQQIQRDNKANYPESGKIKVGK